MYFSFPNFFTLLFLIVVIVGFFVFGLFRLVAQGIENLGLAPEIAIGILVAILIGSFINIPLSRKKIVAVQEERFMGLRKRERMQISGLAINVGGAIIPLFLALYLLPRVPWQPTAIATALMIVLSFFVSRTISGRGIGLSMILPAIFAALFGLILAPDAAAPVAFISGVIGVLVGADVARLSQVNKGEPKMLSIGGAGVFDGIVLVGIVSALLAGWGAGAM